jgi:hypothetical protein
LLSAYQARILLLDLLTTVTDPYLTNMHTQVIKEPQFRQLPVTPCMMVEVEFYEGITEFTEYYGFLLLYRESLLFFA